LLDSQTLSTARVIVMKHKVGTKELTFFTAIPPANIIGYRKSGRTGVPFIPLHRRVT
jgi:hypothetical protein